MDQLEFSKLIIKNLNQYFIPDLSKIILSYAYNRQNLFLYETSLIEQFINKNNLSRNKIKNIQIVANNFPLFSCKFHNIFKKIVNGIDESYKGFMIEMFDIITNTTKSNEEKDTETTVIVNTYIVQHIIKKKSQCIIL